MEACSLNKRLYVTHRTRSASPRRGPSRGAAPDGDAAARGGATAPPRVCGVGIGTVAAHASGPCDVKKPRTPRRGGRAAAAVPPTTPPAAGRRPTARAPPPRPPAPPPAAPPPPSSRRARRAAPRRAVVAARRPRPSTPRAPARLLRRAAPPCARRAARGRRGVAAARPRPRAIPPRAARSRGGSFHAEHVAVQRRVLRLAEGGVAIGSSRLSRWLQCTATSSPAGRARWGFELHTRGTRVGRVRNRFRRRRAARRRCARPPYTAYLYFKNGKRSAERRTLASSSVFAVVCT